VSSDPELERLLRDAGTTLPEPDVASSSRARALALSSLRRRRPRRLRLAAAMGVALVLALAFGIGLGALVAPSSEAAKGPVGIGFLPQPGWYALQADGQANRTFQTIAVASNRPFEREDDVAGRADASGLPYATLLKLPPDGIVIVAAFMRSDRLQFGHYYPERKLPLRVRDATPYLQYGTQVRPEQPLAQYQLQAAVNDHNVDVQIYFGSPEPSPQLLDEAQSQLDRLVVRSPRRALRADGRPLTGKATAAPGLLDRTFLCAPALVGGVRQIDVRAHAGSRRVGSVWDSPAFAAVSTTVSGSVFTAIADELVWVTAGRPSAHAGVIGVFAGARFPVRTWGTLAVNNRRCRAINRVPTSRTGLDGGAVGPFDDKWDCAVSGRVVVRVRAVLGRRTSLRSYRGFLRTTVPVESASLIVRTPAGRPLGYAEVLESGKGLLFMSNSCFPD
jgi:hypothetical protein